MNRKLISSYVVAGAFFSFALASSTQAFWPFDSLFKKSGDVKANTTEKMYISESGQGGDKASMTYQTLAGMNDACRRILSQDFPAPTKTKITPSLREKQAVNEKGTETSAGLVKTTQTIDSKDEKEMLSIFNNLKARCENISSLVTRMQKIYKGQTRPLEGRTETRDTKTVEKVTPTKRPMINFKMNYDKKDTNSEQNKQKTDDSVIPGGG